jgi:hypothetical protein
MSMIFMGTSECGLGVGRKFSLVDSQVEFSRRNAMERATKKTRIFGPDRQRGEIRRGILRERAFPGIAFCTVGRGEGWGFEEVVEPGVSHKKANWFENQFACGPNRAPEPGGASAYPPGALPMTVPI